MELIRLLSRQQFIEEHPQGVDIAHRRRRFPPELFGTGVVGRQEAEPCAGAFVGCSVLAEEFRDSEVKEFWCSVCGDENIPWLDIAVDHEVLVRKPDRAAHRLEETEPFRDGELVLVAVFIDALPVDKLHDEVRHGVVVGARVHKLCDVGVLQGCQERPLRLEPPDHLSPGKGGTDEFDRDPPLELSVIAHCFVHFSHSPGPDLPDYAITPEW